MLFNFVQSAIGFTDTIFLGRVGVVEMSACGIMAIYYLIFMMVGFGLSRGGQILIARRVGEKNYGKVGLITDHLFLFEMALAAFLLAFLHLTSSFVVPMFIQSQEILEAGWEYLRFRSFGIFFSLYGFVLLAFYSGIGRTTPLIYVTITLGIVNAILNYGLIFGRLGLPEMGIAGAGLASTIAEGIAALVGTIYLLNDPARKKTNLFRFNKIDFGIIKRMTRLSTPLVLQFLIGLGGWFVFFTFLENMGEKALAISVVLRWLSSFYMIPALGASTAVNTLVSNSIGQGNYDQSVVAIKRSVWFSLGLTALIVITLCLFPQTIANIFTDDISIIEATPKIYPVLIAILLMNSVASVLFNGLIGAGATRASLIIETAGVILYLTFAYQIINTFDMGLGYAWFSEFIYWFLLFIFTMGYFYSGRWRRHNL